MTPDELIERVVGAIKTECLYGGSDERLARAAIRVVIEEIARFGDETKDYWRRNYAYTRDVYDAGMIDGVDAVVRHIRALMPKENA